MNQGGARGPTIRDVAEAAGVSISTASNAIRGTRYVSEPLRSRVLQVMRDLGYEPNALASGLRSHETRTIGVVVPNIANPFDGTFSTALESAAVQAGYSVVLSLSHYDPERETAHVRKLTGKRVDGIVILPAADHTPAIHHAQQWGIPVITADLPSDDPAIDSVTVDNRRGGYLTARHLLDLGHRDIAHICGQTDRESSRERLIGFRAAMAEAGLDVRPEWMIDVPHLDFAHTQSIVRRLLEMPRLPTAICFGNDHMALGGLSTLCAAGLDVPRDISIIGFDDIWMAALARPALTTVRQPVERMAQEAFALLLERIGGPEPVRGRRIVLGVELVERDSCRRLPAAGRKVCAA